MQPTNQNPQPLKALQHSIEAQLHAIKACQHELNRVRQSLNRQLHRIKWRQLSINDQRQPLNPRKPPQNAHVNSLDDLAISINALANLLNTFDEDSDDLASSKTPANPQFFTKRLDEDADKLNFYGEAPSTNNRTNMNIRLSNQINMVGACITTANTTENKAVWNGNPPLDFTTDIATLQTDYAAVTAKAALADSATGGAGDAKAQAESALEDAAFILARALANHFKKTGNLDKLGQVDVSKSQIVQLRQQDLLDKTTAIRDLGTATLPEPGAAGRGVTAARITTLTNAINAFTGVMNMPRGQIVNRSTLLKEVDTDTADLMEQVASMDDLVMQYDGTDAGKRFIQAWKQARIIVDTGGGHASTPPTPPTPPATPHP